MTHSRRNFLKTLGVTASAAAVVHLIDGPFSLVQRIEAAPSWKWRSPSESHPGHVGPSERPPFRWPISVRRRLIAQRSPR